MITFIRRTVLAGSKKNMSGPHVFILLCVYFLITTVYTGVFYDFRMTLVRCGLNTLLLAVFVLLERSRLSVPATAYLSPTLMSVIIIAGAVVLEGDSLLFIYLTCCAMIALTYFNNKSLLLHIVTVGAASLAVIFIYPPQVETQTFVSLLGVTFSLTQNIIFLMAFIALDLLVYTFGSAYVKTLQALTEAKNEANQANQAKSSFLSTMSHEIRTPLNAILGITEILLQKEMLDPQEKEALYKVYTSGDLLLGIINDILDLSKIEAGKLELAVADYESASLISDTAQLNIMRIGRKPITFEVSVDEELPIRLSGDELRVKQILNNLLSNAFKYTAEGTVRLSVSVEKDSSGTEAVLLINVKDTGQGMSKEQVDRLFDEYSRFNTAANRTTEGTGLGMSITRNLVHMMNGKILVESEPGVGSSFTVRLPQGKLADAVLGRELAENLQQFHTNIAAHMEKLQVEREYMPYGKVLVVDDVETNIYVAKGFLTPYGLKVDSADSGFEALEKVKSGQVYDIIFMDHMMPVMDGMETTAKIREMGYTNPIVALTADAVAGQSEMFLEHGFDGFISKPIEIPQMNDVLNRLIRDKQPPEVLEAARRAAQAIHEHLQAQPDVDPMVAEIFLRDAKHAAEMLEGFNAETELRPFVICVHGMKSALANIGQTELSAAALKLETAGRAEDRETVNAQTPAFLASLKTLIMELSPEEEGGTAEMSEEDEVFLREKLAAIKEACGEYDSNTADGIMAELRAKPWPPQVKERLNAIAESLLHSDFDTVMELINKD
ncbi:MAG: ATP-binding protein [Oscillospiraceae bacterium]|nr:ATP-binding protein [Oscillospiraceae bacterium]